MVAMVPFPLVRCVLTPVARQPKRKAQNLSILSYHFDNPDDCLCPLRPVAIAKSFPGHHIGASEGLKGLVVSDRPPPGTQDPGPHDRSLHVGGVLGSSPRSTQYPWHDRPGWAKTVSILFLDADVRHPQGAGHTGRRRMCL